MSSISLASIKYVQFVIPCHAPVARALYMLHNTCYKVKSFKPLLISYMYFELITVNCFISSVPIFVKL